jgi:hypothetical protein
MTEENCSTTTDDTQSAHVVEVHPPCPCCGGCWDPSQNSYWDPDGYLLGKGWHVSW